MEALLTILTIIMSLLVPAYSTLLLHSHIFGKKEAVRVRVRKDSERNFFDDR